MTGVLLFDRKPLNVSDDSIQFKTNRLKASRKGNDRVKAVWFIKIFIFSLLLVVCQTTPVKKAEAGEISRDDLMAFHPVRSSLPIMQNRGFMSTGLKPVYPSGANCPKITSFFADPKRGDGSFRNERFYHGYHGGIDIPTPEGTPVLTIADGTVISTREGKSIGGIKMALQHSPEDTGLPFWLYSQYKHLQELPGIEIGAKVKKGEQIALSGLTGTVGGHYGEEGHAHLHLNVFMSTTDKFKAKKALIPVGGHWVDPLALYFGKDLNTHSLRSLPNKDKKVKIPYVTTGGNIVPTGTRFVWPLPCSPR